MLPLVVPDVEQAFRWLRVHTAVFIYETGQWSFNRLILECRIYTSRPDLIDWSYLTAEAERKAHEIDPGWREYTNGIVPDEEVLKWSVV